MLNQKGHICTSVWRKLLQVRVTSSEVIQCDYFYGTAPVLESPALVEQKPPVRTRFKNITQAVKISVAPMFSIAWYGYRTH